MITRTWSKTLVYCRKFPTKTSAILAVFHLFITEEPVIKLNELYPRIDTALSKTTFLQFLLKHKEQKQLLLKQIEAKTVLKNNGFCIFFFKLNDTVQIST